MIRAATASIVHEDAFWAGREVIRELRDELGSAPGLVLLFASSLVDQARLLDGVASVLPASCRLVGCSSLAEIDNREALLRSVTAMGICFDGAVGCETFRLEGPVTDPLSAGRALGERVKSVSPSLLLLFPDGLRMHVAPFLRGLQDVLGPRFPIAGGIPSDDNKHQATHEYEGRSAFSGGVAAAAFTGPLDIACAARAGFRPVGTPRTSTRVDDGHILVELDGTPALDLYRQHLGDNAERMPYAGLDFPLGILGGNLGLQTIDEGNDICLIRAPYAFDETRKGLVCLGDVPLGARIAMTRTTKDDLIRAAVDACDIALRAMSNPDVAFIFSCGGRKLLFDVRFHEEMEHVSARLGEALPKIGFYTYGEIAAVNGVTMCHNETFALVLLKERQ